MTLSSGPLASAGAAAGHGLPGAALRRVLDHIEANLHRDPPLSELSARACMSAFHFARLFKRSTGLPPHRFVVGRRIGRARELLETKNVSIATVAQAVGFRTPSHFTTAFRRSMGVTPSAYRAAVRGYASRAATRRARRRRDEDTHERVGRDAPGACHPPAASRPVGAALTATSCERAIVGQWPRERPRSQHVERRPDRYGVSDQMGVAMTRFPSSEVAPVTITRSPHA